MFSSSGKSGFDKLLDVACSPMLLDPNWVTNLEICDSIRQGDVSPKYAVASIRKRMKDQRPLVAKYSLIVLETCVKNCGSSFHEEIATQEFMEEMRNLASTGSQPVKEQVLAMMQAWNHVFRNKTQFQPILATYNLMKMEGHNFPPLNESDAMFSSDVAPAWKEGDVCHMCRVKFSTFTRQHHCRACGEVFCGKCSSKVSIIPKVGIEREVRVCDPCYDEINPNDGKDEVVPTNTTDEAGNELPEEYLNSALAKEAQTKPALTDKDRQAQEEEEMQLALALSLSENEVSAKPPPVKNWAPPSDHAPQYKLPPASAYPEIPKTNLKSSASDVSSSLYAAASAEAVQADSASSELSKYLDRSYWEKKNAEIKRSEPSAPVNYPIDTVTQAKEPIYAVVASGGGEANLSDDESSESDAFVQTMEKSIEMFIDRMNNVRYKGKHIAMDSTVQSLFQSLSAMHPQLIKLIEDEEESKAKYEAMLEKLSVIREARESLNDMRAQHGEKVQQQELEQEMLRRMQMEQKLELMRQQKQEYLEYQRQLQIQRQKELDVFQQEKMRQQMGVGMPMGVRMPGYMGEIPVESLNNSMVAKPPHTPIPRPQMPPSSVQQGYGRPPQYPGGPPQSYYQGDGINQSELSFDAVSPPSYDYAVKPAYPVQPGAQPVTSTDPYYKNQYNSPNHQSQAQVPVPRNQNDRSYPPQVLPNQAPSQLRGVTQAQPSVATPAIHHHQSGYPQPYVSPQKIAEHSPQHLPPSSMQHTQPQAQFNERPVQQQAIQTPAMQQQAIQSPSPQQFQPQTNQPPQAMRQLPPSNLPPNHQLQPNSHPNQPQGYIQQPVSQPPYQQSPGQIQVPPQNTPQYTPPQSNTQPSQQYQPQPPIMTQQSTEPIPQQYQAQHQFVQSQSIPPPQQQPYTQQVAPPQQQTAPPQQQIAPPQQQVPLQVQHQQQQMPPQQPIQQVGPPQAQPQVSVQQSFPPQGQVQGQYQQPIQNSQQAIPPQQQQYGYPQQPQYQQSQQYQQPVEAMTENMKDLELISF